MCHGPLFRKILLFALPLLLTNILQLLFHAADLIVVGRFASYEAMAAIGCTSSMNNLCLNVFIAISIGTNVLVSRYFGAQDSGNIRKTVHTSLAFSFFGGLILMTVVLFAAKPLLVLMGTPETILPKSCKYIWICFSAVPFIMVYNFGCAVLRAVGDTKRPFLFLVIAGIVNVVLNLILVIVFGLDVEGVAIATAISHVIAAGLIVRTLCKSDGDIKLYFKSLRIDPVILKEMLWIGIPAGVQSSCFSVSNMLIQSSINFFGPVAIAGMTAAFGLEAIVYIAAYASHFTAISFVSQNLGGQHYKRILKSMGYCYLFTLMGTVTLGYLFLFFGRTLLAFYNPDPAVIEWGMIRLKILLTTYCFCGFMDTASGGLRGLGYSLVSTVISLSGACLFRIFWVVFVFPKHKTMECLMISYPVSWALTACIGTTVFLLLYRRIVRKRCARFVEWSKYGPGIPRGYRHYGNPR